MSKFTVTEPQKTDKTDIGYKSISVVCLQPIISQTFRKVSTLKKLLYKSSLVSTEGWQNMPTQNMPPWHKCYFELKPIEREQTLRKTLCSPSFTSAERTFEKVPPDSLSRGTEVNLQRYQPSGQCSWSCPTLCDLTDCSPPGSSVYGISPARILQWVAISEEPKHQTLLTNPYYPLVPPYILFSTICCPRSSMSFPFVLSLLYKFIVLWLRGYRMASSNHLFVLLMPRYSHVYVCCVC